MYIHLIICLLFATPNASVHFNLQQHACADVKNLTFPLHWNKQIIHASNFNCFCRIFFYLHLNLSPFNTLIKPIPPYNLPRCFLALTATPSLSLTLPLPLSHSPSLSLSLSLTLSFPLSHSLSISLPLSPSPSLSLSLSSYYYFLLTLPSILLSLW